jgi:hypothetical protein
VPIVAPVPTDVPVPIVLPVPTVVSVPIVRMWKQ